MSTSSRPDETAETRRPLPLAVKIGLGACLLLLCLHAGLYWFLTDDAFISFRYARNLADGAGLVFNPGSEPVEGYTNFLWVIMLAGFAAAGVPPESVANVLSLTAGIVLWLLVVRHAVRHPPPGRFAWLVIAPALWLAVTRSYAVWCTSGLETKLFELLIVAGVLRTLSEMESSRQGRPASNVLSMLMLALATLTRPDGLLISACVAAVRVGCELRSGTQRWRRTIPGAAVYVAIVGGHFLFRRMYYGDWLPNTVYAKVSGTWWSMGGRYAACWLLEYGAVLWLPLLLAGVIGNVRRGRADVPLLLAAAIVPHLIYVISIGGDHFEYRPIDLYFPLLFLLMYDGAKHLAAGIRRAAGLAAYVVLCAVGLTALPMLGHLQFPGNYKPGFPGIEARDDGSRDLISRDAYPLLFRVPLIKQYCDAYNHLIVKTSAQFVGLRQEEHKLFLATVVPEGKLLARLVAEGRIPADLYVAIDSVGAIPYYSNLRTLDRLGLTDKWVAHKGQHDPHRRMMAHDKFAPPDYAEKLGVDIWAVHYVHLIFDVTDPELFEGVVRTTTGHGKRCFVLPVDEDHYLLGMFPSDEPPRESVRRLPWVPLAALAHDPAYLRRMREHLEEQIRTSPADADAHHELGVLLRLSGDLAGAATQFAKARELEPNHAKATFDLASVLMESGQTARAIELLEEAVRTLPPSVPTHNELGRALAARGDLDAAAAHFEDALAIDNTDADAHCNLANVLAQRGQVDEAIEHYETAIRYHSRHALAYENLANLLTRLGRYADAIDVLRASRRVMPRNAELAIQLSWLLATAPDAGARDGTTALSVAQEVCQRKGRDDPRRLRALAAAQAEVGRFEDAAETARRAIELANSLDLANLADELRTHLAAYESDRPIRLPPR